MSRFLLYFSITGIAFAYVVWFQQATLSAWCNDEAAHIPAGLYHLETGKMDSCRVSPPLPRMIAALPLLVDRPKIDWLHSGSPYIRSEYIFADQWVRDNTQTLPRYLLLTRSMVLLFFVIGLWSIVRWAQQLYGSAAAWLAGAMWTFNPDVVTHTSVVTADLPAAATGLLVGYLFWKWLKQSQRSFPWLVATAVAFAILCKFSWIFLLFALPAITLAYDGLARRSSEVLENDLGIGMLAKSYVPMVCRDAFRLSLSFSLTLLLINWCYGFDGTGTRLGDFGFVSKSLVGCEVAESGVIQGDTGNRFANGPLAWLPVPLPKEMVRGIDYLKWEFEKGYPSYLRGTWQDHGWWYFYLYAMAIKMPLGYWVLIGCGFASLIWQSCRLGPRYSLEWLPTVLAVLFLALISSQAGFTHHVRYVLPVYGFLFLLASRVMVVFPRRLAIGLAAVCLSGTIWFHATHPGLAHTFFNPAAGGPNNGWRHLSFSNVDWGQSTYRMVDWIKDHPEQRPMTVQFRSSLGNPKQLVSEFENVSTQVDWQPLTDNRAAVPTCSGWYLISSFQMTREQNRFFRDRAPVAQPYPDVLLFYVDAEEIPFEEINSRPAAAKIDSTMPLNSNANSSIQ